MEINDMEKTILHSWSLAPQQDPFKMQFPFSSVDQLKKMIEDLDAQLKFYNRNKTPDDRWWEAQHPDEWIPNHNRGIHGQVTHTFRHYTPKEAQWDLDMARMQLMIHTLPKSLKIDPTLRKTLDDATEHELQKIEDQFLELQLDILSTIITNGLHSRQPHKPVALFSGAPWAPVLGPGCRIATYAALDSPRYTFVNRDDRNLCRRRANMLQSAMCDIPPLVDKMHALQKEADAILSDFEVKRVECDERMKAEERKYVCAVLRAKRLKERLRALIEAQETDTDATEPLKTAIFARDSEEFEDFIASLDRNKLRSVAAALKVKIKKGDTAGNIRSRLLLS